MLSSFLLLSQELGHQNNIPEPCDLHADRPDENQLHASAKSEEEYHKISCTLRIILLFLLAKDTQQSSSVAIQGGFPCYSDSPSYSDLTQWPRQMTRVLKTVKTNMTDGLWLSGSSCCSQICYLLLALDSQYRWNGCLPLYHIWGDMHK